jgi:hypothetical protein
MNRRNEIYMALNNLIFILFFFIKTKQHSFNQLGVTDLVQSYFK